MSPQTVRAVLAYLMTVSLLICLFLVAFKTLTQFQTALVSTIIGALIANAKVPLSYFFDGVASPDNVTPAAAAPAPEPVPPVPPQP